MDPVDHGNPGILSDYAGRGDDWIGGEKSIPGAAKGEDPRLIHWQWDIYSSCIGIWKSPLLYQNTCSSKQVNYWGLTPH